MKTYPGRRMDREAEAIKENPRKKLKAIFLLILVCRQRKLPTVPLACGNQSANIRVVYRRVTCFSIFLAAQISGGMQVG